MGRKRNRSPSSPRVEERPGVEAKPRRIVRAIVVVSAAVTLALVALFVARHAQETDTKTLHASFVGSTACASCHAGESAEWNRSQHRAAMSVASEQTVLGNFSGTQFMYAGTTSTFFRRDGKFFVHTDGPDGSLAEYEVKYTFGVQPLQQYLVELPRGRVQALSIAWDSRPKSQNGQRWFHLYPSENITHTDELHWSRPAQNWNFMCADCHSTGVRKNYDRDADGFQTHFAEISVGCEACHSPGSLHIEWASSRATNRVAQRDSTKGLTARLDERRGVAWTAVAATGNASRSHPRTTDREVETCAQCHSRRSQIADGYEAGKPFLDYYRPAMLSRPLYQTDGQQHDEVYIWGSFLQSRMNARGVTCSDCHNPHTGKLRADGNAVCATCHLPAKYDTPQHHHHQSATAGASCAGCHMPTTTYMVVDPRHDHSLRVPRPDLSVALGTPNACTNCHTTRDARWAAASVREWYGRNAASATHERVAMTFAAADAGALDGQALLRVLAADGRQSPIARATALTELNPPQDAAALAVLTDGLRDSSDLVRFGALQSLARLPLDSRIRLAEPLLSDPLRAIRIEAARMLAAAPVQQLSQDWQVAFQRAAAEFVETQQYNADQAEARVSLGTFLAERGDATGADAELQSAIRIGPSSIPAYVNLADLYRAQGRDTEGERILRQGLLEAPKSGALHYALGLALTRLNRADTALAEFARAAGLEPDNARFAYVNAIALHSNGKLDAAIAQLKAALTLHPANADILSALAKFYAEQGDAVQAKRYAEQLRTLSLNR